MDRTRTPQAGPAGAGQGSPMVHCFTSTTSGAPGPDRIHSWDRTPRRPLPRVDAEPRGAGSSRRRQMALTLLLLSERRRVFKAACAGRPRSPGIHAGTARLVRGSRRRCRNGPPRMRCPCDPAFPPFPAAGFAHAPGGGDGRSAPWEPRRRGAGFHALRRRTARDASAATAAPPLLLRAASRRSTIPPAGGGTEAGSG
jgi:hypothetical protein